MLTDEVWLYNVSKLTSYSPVLQMSPNPKYTTWSWFLGYTGILSSYFLQSFAEETIRSGSPWLEVRLQDVKCKMVSLLLAVFTTDSLLIPTVTWKSSVAHRKLTELLSFFGEIQRARHTIWPADEFESASHNRDVRWIYWSDGQNTKFIDSM